MYIRQQFFHMGHLLICVTQIHSENTLYGSPCCIKQCYVKCGLQISISHQYFFKQVNNDVSPKFESNLILQCCTKYWSWNKLEKQKKLKQRNKHLILSIREFEKPWTETFLWLSDFPFSWFSFVEVQKNPRHFCCWTLKRHVSVDITVKWLGSFPISG